MLLTECCLFKLLDIEVITFQIYQTELLNANIIDETAATLAWSIFDNDGLVDHDLQISLDGIEQNSLQPLYH